MDGTGATDTIAHTLPEDPTTVSQTEPSQAISTPEDLKKCWICFADESEDTPTTSPWKSPCPCALVAHEECLLDWIADKESASAQTALEIKCPQCKADIVLQRPRDAVVEMVQSIQRTAAVAVLPALSLVATGTIYHAFQIHGMHSILMIFGDDHGLRILQPMLLSSSRAVVNWGPQELLRHLHRNWRLLIGVPLITPSILMSRTRLADRFLPLIPLALLATRDPRFDYGVTTGLWPPSPSMTVIALPYVRAMYNACYDRFVAPHEKKWLAAVRPRAGQVEQPEADLQHLDHDHDHDHHHHHHHGVDAQVQVEVRLDADIFGGWNQPAPEAEPFNPPAVEPQQIEAGNMPAADQPPQDAPVGIPADQPVVVNREQRLSISTTDLAEKFLGALLLPAFSALAGEGLKHVLPAKWTMPSPTAIGLQRFTATSKVAPGLLQQRWWRSIVGGCLLVVLKDAVTLYVRWKMAVQHKQRKVLDYQGKRKIRT